MPINSNNKKRIISWRAIPFLLFMVMSVGQGFAQDKPPVTFGKVLQSDFAPIISTVVDSSAAAVIIADIGSTGFVGNKDGWISYVFKRHTRIKILNKKGLEAATVKISLFHNERDAEKLDNLEASAYKLETARSPRQSFKRRKYMRNNWIKIA